ncbi:MULTISPECIES: TetR/AcrR family transcriptional regulator [Actinokineospora]|nr:MULTISPECIES: TetR/AcrR family transcriptional regulator [Actinokineospora]
MGDTRTEILRATLRVIGAEGVAGVTNRRIAREAGVSLGSITYHFDTQTSLLRETMLLFVAEETARLASVAEAHRSVISVDDAAALVERIVESTAFGSEEIAPLELYIHAGRDASLREAAATCFAAYDALATAVLSALGVPDPARMAGPVVALIAGLQLRRLATGTSGPTTVADALRLLVAA